MAHEVFDDLELECELFDATLSEFDDAGWSGPTLCEGWNVRDLLVHLWIQADVAVQSMDGGAENLPFDVSRIPELHQVIDHGVRAHRYLAGPVVWRRWRDTRSEAIDRMRRLAPGQRVRWTVSEMSGMTLGTTLIMEYWAHRHDVRGPLGLPPEPSPGMRHVAWFVNWTLPFAFQMTGEKFRPVRFELDAPDGETWRFGPDDAEDIVRGSALELCLRGVNRLDLADAQTLVAEGKTAEIALRVMKTYP